MEITVIISNIILLALGFLIGFGAAKILKGALLIVVAIIILGIVGVTIAGFAIPNLKDMMALVEPFKDIGGKIISTLSQYPMIAAGLILGLIVGLVK